MKHIVDPLIKNRFSFAIRERNIVGIRHRMQEKRMVQETFFCLKFMKFKEPYYINNSILQVNLLLATRFGKNNSKNIPLVQQKHVY